MKITEGFNKYLLLSGLVSLFLVFWLGASFWKDTFIQRFEATQLQAATLPENTFFDLAQNIGNARTSAHLLLVAPAYDVDQMDAFFDISKQTHELLTKTIEEVRESRQTQSFLTNPRYSDSTVEGLITTLKDRHAELSQYNYIVQAQSIATPKYRDEQMHLWLFDEYSALVQDLNNLRLRSLYVPNEKNNEVTAGQNLMHAIWDINEASSQINTIVGGYYEKLNYADQTSIDKNGLLYRIYQQVQSTEQALLEITEYLDSESPDLEFSNSIKDYTDWHATQYKPAERQLLNKISNKSTSTEHITNWNLISTKLLSKTQKISNQAISQELLLAKNIKRSANTKLLLDTLLVIICMTMAVASLNYASTAQKQATHDELTQLPNRRYFQQILQQSLGHINFEKEVLALITIDLNRFKIINDTMGHAVGDAVLKKVATRLRKLSENRLTVARMGGDEFSLLFTAADKHKVFAVGEEVQKTISESFTIDGQTIAIGASVGISCFPIDADNAEELQITSDFAMFHAKQCNGDNVEYYDREMANRFEHKAGIERDLARAIENNELELYYQPQFDIQQNRISGVEALVRWIHPTKGFIAPDQFIGIAEECGLMPSIGTWVLKEACRQATVWKNDTQLDLRVAINISVHQIMQSSFVPMVINELEENKLDARFIELEVTESVIMTEIELVAKSLLNLQKAGIKIALDDFGTGYSSLSQLQELPIDTLKIDRAFISKLDSNSDVAKSFTKTIAMIAEVLQLESVAEGVETEDQVAQVAALGITTIQGYHYSRPVPAGELVAVVEQINEQQQQQATIDKAA